MGNKYYTPELNEFFDKFEYEFFDFVWKKSIFDFRDLDVIDDEIKEGKIRVKHLDREDIESLGWEQIEYDSFKIGSFIFELNNEYKSFIYLEKDKDNVFVGKIKNKSELRKLMQQLNINSGGK